MILPCCVCCRWVAFPDSQAGTDYYTVSYDPPFYGSQFAVVNIQDVPVTINISYTGRAIPNLPETFFQLNSGEVLQIQVTNVGHVIGGCQLS